MLEPDAGVSEEVSPAMCYPPSNYVLVIRASFRTVQAIKNQELGRVSVAQFPDEFNRNCRVLLQKAFAIPLRSVAKGRFTRSVAVPSQTSQGIEM